MPLSLKNNQLEVLIGKPMELYRGARFDHSGNILQVTLNGKHRFCTTEKREHDPMFGFGLLNEFDIDRPMDYGATPPGTWFQKIGVGKLLKDEDAPYDFFKNYKMLPQEFSLQKRDDISLLFQAEEKQSSPFKIHYQKRISIRENHLLIEYFLKNQSTRPLVSNEYAHNFMAIDHTGVDQNLLLEFNFEMNPHQFEAVHNIERLMSFSKHAISWTAQPDSDFFIRRVNGNTSEGKWWRLSKPALGLGVKEEVSFGAGLVNLWGSGHVVSPEFFHRIELKPDQVTSWWRKYTFFDEATSTIEH